MSLGLQLGYKRELFLTQKYLKSNIVIKLGALTKLRKMLVVHIIFVLCKVLIILFHILDFTWRRFIY